MLLIIISALAIVFADVIVLTFSRFSEPEQIILTTRLMRIMLLTPAIFGVSGLLMGLLQANQRFLLPALAPAFYNAGIIFGTLVLEPQMGIFGLAWGTVLGAALHFFIQVPAVFKIQLHYQPILNIRHAGVKEIARLMGPRVLGLAVVQVNFIVNLFLASGMVEGSVSALTRAFIVMLLPQGIIAQSVATAVFPTFAAQVSAGKREELQSTFGQVLRAIIFLAVPATVGIVLLRTQIVSLIFEYGSFTASDRDATAWALLFYGLGLVSHSIVEITTRAFYAMHDTKTPVLIGIITVFGNVGLSFLLVNYIGETGSLVRGPFAGLALANTIATSLEALALLVLLSPRIGGYTPTRTGLTVVRTVAASVVMGGLLIAALPLINQVWLPAGVLGTIAIAGIVYWIVVWVLGSEEARLFTSTVMRRLNRT